jgi:hypothetical protein
MSFSRRQFIQWAAAASTLTVASRSGTKFVSLLEAAAPGFRPELFPTQKEMWDHETWMAGLGPKYTGNKAHTTFVDFLETQMKSYGLDVAREHYTVPERWDAKRWEIAIAPASGSSFKAPVTSYFPYSGHTPAAGATGELVYAGSAPNFTLDGLQGKVALVDFKAGVRDWSKEYKVWGVNPPGETFPSSVRPARGGVNDLTQFAKAGAVGVIIGWTDVSDANAADQYTPFSRPHQGMPSLYVGRNTLAKLKALAGTGAKATVVLEADIVPNAPTDTVIATLPGSSSDEVIIVNTHTDGPNATEENGGVGLVTLAKYFSKIPKADRKRTLVFPMTTGHFASPWVPSIRGFIEKYPDTMKKAVAALTVEHLGCLEWMDDAQMNYKATGKNEWSVAITPSSGTGMALVDALKGSRDRCGVVNPVAGGFLGEGSALSRAGIPTIGYIPQPNYLLAGPANGCIEKLSGDLMYSQLQVFAKLIHTMDGMSKEQLKGV